MKKIFIIFAFLFLWTLSAKSAFAFNTWYVRTDGGTITQCTGLADAAYPGSGTNQACAVNHPFWLLSAKDQTTVISGGDTVIIGPGSYMMGINQTGDQAPNTGSKSCSSGAGTFTCMMPPIPSGPDAAHPTTIIGENWDTKATAPPELWGAGRVSHIFDLTNSNNVVLRYLNITDHAQCGYNMLGSSMLCNRTVAPYGYQADYGIYAKDSSNVLLKDINLHGLSNGGLWGGRLTDWTFDHVNIMGNAFNGWNGDVGHGPFGSGTDSSMHGTITVEDSKIDYNGCVEKYPLTENYPLTDDDYSNIATGGCYGQGQGGYGDGFGMYFTVGDWNIQDSEFMHNTQDGLDLLYHTGESGSVTVNRVRAEGNVGQQIKMGANALVENSVIVGDCNYFFNNPITYNSGSFPHCRAAGTPIVFANWGSGHEASIINSTVVGPNKVFIEATSGGTLGQSGVNGSLTNVSSITSVNQYRVDQASDTMWIELSNSSLDPNNFQILPRIGTGSVTTSYPLSGTWISDGNGIYHLTGIGAQTSNNYVFTGVYYVETDGSAAAVTTDNEWSINTSADTLWARLPGSQDPNTFNIVVEYNNFNSKTTLSGTWISDGNGIYHLTGIGAQTNNIYALNYVIRAGICDGSQKVYSRNNIFDGMEWWSASQQALSPGTYPDTFYLDGWDGNGNGSCAATNPVTLDNKDTIIYNSKYDLSSGPNDVLGVDPALTSIPPYNNYNNIYTYAYGERWNVIPQTGSPAINHASSSASANVFDSATFGSVTIPVLDFLNHPRPYGSGIDWGAYEVGSGADTTPPAAPSGLSVI